MQSFSYAYDDAGNRISVLTAAGTESYTFDLLNRLTEVDYANGDVVTYTYDANGNLTARGSDSFTWNWANPLGSATVNGTTADYMYDSSTTTSPHRTCALGFVRPRVTALLDTAIDGCIQLCINVKAPVPGL
ncbi:MAG TPA: RHS repeat domain-containing protein [Nitrolancea sp.]